MLIKNNATVGVTIFGSDGEALTLKAGESVDFEAAPLELELPDGPHTEDELHAIARDHIGKHWTWRIGGAR